MKSTLPFLTYLVAFFGTHTSCAPQSTYNEDFYVSSGQTCSVEGGIEGKYLTALGNIKNSCDSLAFDPNSFGITVDHREMRCWFKKECSKGGVSGLCLNKGCLSESEQQNWSKDTTCPKSALDIGCYIEPSSSTSKALDKQAFSAPQNADSFIIADSSSSTSSSTTPRPPPTTSFQTAGLLPIIFDDSSSSSTSANPEADYYLQGQNNLGQTDYYPPSLLNNNVEQAQQGFAEYY